jgi:hypothetical protein
MNDEETQKMIDVVEEAYKLGLFSGRYDVYLSFRSRIVRTKSEVDSLRNDIEKLSSSIQRLKEVRGQK